MLDASSAEDAVCPLASFLDEIVCFSGHYVSRRIAVRFVQSTGGTAEEVAHLADKPVVDEAELEPLHLFDDATSQAMLEDEYTTTGVIMRW